MPRRVGEPEPISGSERRPTWRIALSEDPTVEWRRQFLRYAHASGIFYDVQMPFASAAVVFEIERSALGLACEQIDTWIGQANGEPSLASGYTHAQSPAPRAPTILVVDDDPTIGPWVRGALEPLGYAVLETGDPREAIRMGTHRPGNIDLLLVDVVMPLMDGRKLAQRLCSLRPTLKVLLMSGYGLSGLEATGWPFIAKPFGMDDLARTVANTLREKVPASLPRHGVP